MSSFLKKVPSREPSGMWNSTTPNPTIRDIGDPLEDRWFSVKALLCCFISSLTLICVIVLFANMLWKQSRARRSHPNDQDASSRDSTLQPSAPAFSEENDQNRDWLRERGAD